MSPRTLLVNRAPVLTLWAAVVAERLGHSHDAALTLGKAVAGLNAQSKGRRLGIFGSGEPKAKSSESQPSKAAPSDTILLLGRAVPVTKTPAGMRALVKGKPESATAVQRYLDQKFGTDLATAKAAMTTLARAVPPGQLEHEAFTLYEAFRPEIPEGGRGWGAKGVLDLARIRRLADRYRE
ncbi:MAG: hypothetical protein ACM3JH_08045 [Acidithiobacillales bacterium]